MGFAALFFVRLQRGVLFPCLQRGLFPCLLPDGSSLQRPCQQRLPDGAPFRQVAFLAGACCRTRFPLSSTAAPASNSAKVPLPAALPDGSLPQCRHPLRHGTPGQQHLPDGSSLQRPCRQSSVPTVPCQQQLCHGVPASNKPHPAEKSTPVWLAIWRTWAGFAPDFITFLRHHIAHNDNQ